MTKIQALPIAQIRRDSGAQFRVGGLNENQIENLIDGIERGDKIPAITVFFDGALYWMGGGDHRIEAHLRAGKAEIEAEIHDGTQKDAVFFGTGDNANHGLPRSPKTKRAQVIATLEGWPELGISGVARHVKVSRPFVYQVINDTPHLSTFTSDTRDYTTKHGTVATMKTGNIGKHLNGVTPEIEPTPEQIEDAKLKYSVIDGALKIGLFLRCVECGPEMNPDALTLGEYLREQLPMLSEDAARQFMSVAAYRHPDRDESATDWPDNSDEAFQGDWAELLRLSNQAWKATKVKEVWPRFKAIMADQMAYSQAA